MKPVPSPIATGGGGERFEQRVDAYALALLLARSTAPILLDSAVVEVHLQTRHLGWKTDDLLIVGEAGAGAVRKLAIQAKLGFIISAADEDCVQTIQGMWDDFVAAERFDPAYDRLAVATLHGTTTLLASFASLLDCARASVSADDFGHRVQPTGYLSKKARAQNEAIITILREHVPGGLDNERYWKFLRVFNVLSFDLGTDTSHTEALLLTLLAHTATGSGDPRAIAQSTWHKLLEVASKGRSAAASYRRESLPTDLREQQGVLADREERARLDLVAHGRTVRNSIRSSIGADYTLDRSADAASLLGQMDAQRAVLVSGSAGSGKSALVKTVLERLELERPVLAFQAVEFATAHINETLAKTQSTLNAQALLALLASHDRIVVFIDGVERLLEHSVRDAFTHLLQMAAQTPAIRLLLTCRDYSLETVRSALLTPAGLDHTVFEVRSVSDNELDALARQVRELAPPLANSQMRSFLRTPYLLDMASRLQWSTETMPQDVRAFRQLCWQRLVRDEAHARDAMPRRREAIFVDVARRRATELRPYVRPETQDVEALTALEDASLLECSPESKSLVAPAHDVLEDWAVLHWLEDLAATAEDQAMALSEAVGGFPAVRRGLRRWLAERLQLDASATTEFVLAVSARADLPQHFRDDCIVAVLLSDAAADFLMKCRERVVAGNVDQLRQVVHLLRVACKVAPHWFPASGLPSTFLVPTGPGWSPTLDLVANELPLAESSDALLALGLVEDWSRQVTIDIPDPAGAESAGRVVSKLLPRLSGYRNDDTRKRALEVLLKIPRHAPAFEDLVRRSVAGERGDICARDFSDLVASTLSGAYASRDFPDAVVEVPDPG